MYVRELGQKSIPLLRQYVIVHAPAGTREQRWTCIASEAGLVVEGTGSYLFMLLDLMNIPDKSQVLIFHTRVHTSKAST